MGKTTAAGLAFLLAAATSAAAQSGPVGYWKGDDGNTPGTAVDSSGNGHPGTYTNGATTSPTVPTLQFLNPTSFSFNGTGANVSVPGFAWPGGGAVTIAYWNNVATGQVQNSSAFTVGNMDNENRFHVHGPWGDKTIYWDYGNINANGRNSTDYTAYLDKWTHVALVSEGMNGAFKAIYLDGVLKASATSSNGPTAGLTGLFIGGWPGANLNHKGLMDDFRIYNRVLTITEIQLLASGAGGPPEPTGLQATPAIGQIQLQWNASAGATGYYLKRTPANATTPTVITVSGTTFTDNGLSPGWPYSYVVSAFNFIGEGPDSSPAVTSSPLSPPPRTQKLGSDDSCGCGTVPVAGPELWSLMAIVAALIAVSGLFRSRI
ncbi:MAG: hypothetical protein EHM91_03585 [Planctomycetota bacterium]|nr:MAG: hypothetical protein EHM91_03585 [Planctomycetota bacterium]